MIDFINHMYRIREEALRHALGGLWELHNWRTREEYDMAVAGIGSWGIDHSLAPSSLRVLHR